MDSFIDQLCEIISSRKGGDPNLSYVAKLFASGVDGIAKKLGEEAIEVVIASKNDDDDALIYEVSDLLFHTLVLLSAKGLSWDSVLAELKRREGVSGIAEKASRQ